MTTMWVHVAGGVPLVRFEGAVTETSGAQLAAAVMSTICYATEDPDEFPHPLSLESPRAAR